MICIMINICLLMFSCRYSSNYESNPESEFTEEEQYLIYRCDSAIKEQLLIIRALQDSISDAHKMNDADKAAAAQYRLLFVTDEFWDDFYSTYLPQIALHHEFDSMAIWFPEEDAILKRHYFSETE